MTEIIKGTFYTCKTYHIIKFLELTEKLQFLSETQKKLYNLNELSRLLVNNLSANKMLRH